MAKYQLEVNVGYGTLVIHFDSVGELEQRLKDLDVKNLGQILSSHFKGMVRAEARKIKPDLEGICTFRPDGSLEFLRPPSSKIEAIGIILFAYDPDPVEISIIGSLAADKNPAAYFGQDKYVKYFHKIKPGLYGLSHDGKVWVSSTVIPKLKKES